MEARSGKRTKDPEIAELRAALERFHDLTEAYRQSLEAEFAAAGREAEPYGQLVRALARQIDALRRLETMLDEGLWPDLIALANGSAYVQHRHVPTLQHERLSSGLCEVERSREAVVAAADDDEVGHLLTTVSLSLSES